LQTRAKALRRVNADRKRAEKALGRPLKRPELVHHHSRKQLVICPDAAYHRMLHTLEDCHGDFKSFYRQYATFHGGRDIRSL
jgi:hypothetical protein